MSNAFKHLGHVFKRAFKITGNDFKKAGKSIHDSAVKSDDKLDHFEDHTLPDWSKKQWDKSVDHYAPYMEAGEGRGGADAQVFGDAETGGEPVLFVAAEDVTTALAQLKDVIPTQHHREVNRLLHRLWWHQHEGPFSE